MSISSSTQVALRVIPVVVLLAFGLQVFPANYSFASMLDGKETRMATYDHAEETNFAISLTVDSVDVSQRSSDIVVYVDTSASQTGIYKRDSIKTLQQLLRHLNSEDRVKVIAIDLEPVAMTKGFVSPGSAELTTAIEKLNKRVALGSTDIELMLNSAANEFETKTGKNKNVIYIGDGISRAGILHNEAFGKAVVSLIDNQISASSFAIGPNRNIEMMAALANHTGGNLFVDTDHEDSVRTGASALAQTVHGSVFWPKSVNISENVVDVFPRRVPPIRMDRDSILVGTMADRSAVELTIAGSVEGIPTTMKWDLQPEASNEDFSFLTGLIFKARKDAGLTMPTVGSEGLREYARAASVEAAQLTKMGRQALAVGDATTAKKLASAALMNDPSNTTADALSMASTYKVQEPDNPFDDPAALATEQQSPFDSAPAEKPADMGSDSKEMDNSAAVDTLPQESGSDTKNDMGAITPAQEPVPQLEAPTANNDRSSLTLIAPGQDVDDFLEQAKKEDREQGGIQVLAEEDRIKIINQRARKQVQFELKRANEEIRANDAVAAIERLKNTIEVVDQTADLFDNTRSELRHTLESSLLSAQQKKLEIDDRRAIATAAIANKRAIDRARVRLLRDDELVFELISRFESLMKEGNFAAAEDVTITALEVAPDNPDVVAANKSARIAHNFERMIAIRNEKQLAFYDSMYQAELSSIPFPGDPALVFDDPEIWKAKRLRRAKYEQFRLSGNENDEKILNALEEPATLQYDETPWSEVEEALERKYRINIVLDQSARDDSLTEDEPITANLQGISLKNALRLMLKEKNATFIVRNEVLLIISLDDAEDTKYFVTNVFNVGDLVAPRSSGGVGGGFGGGGFGGGGFGGGGFGGGGFGGGGFGGGRGGFGGGGGVFCIQEPATLKLGSKADNTVEKAPAKQTSRPTVITLPTNADSATGWNDFFAQTFVDPADVRETVRSMMAEEKSREVVDVILAAIQNDQMPTLDV